LTIDITVAVASRRIVMTVFSILEAYSRLLQHYNNIRVMMMMMMMICHKIIDSMMTR